MVSVVVDLMHEVFTIGKVVAKELDERTELVYARYFVGDPLSMGKSVRRQGEIR